MLKHETNCGILPKIQPPQCENVKFVILYHATGCPSTAMISIFSQILQITFFFSLISVSNLKMTVTGLNQGRDDYV